MRTLSYDQLTSGYVSKRAIQDLVATGELDQATLERMEHLGKFYSSVGALAKPHQKIGDVLSEAQLQRIWDETAAEGDDERPTRPLLDSVMIPA
jgi:hypothetical protein